MVRMRGLGVLQEARGGRRASMGSLWPSGLGVFFTGMRSARSHAGELPSGGSRRPDFNFERLSHLPPNDLAVVKAFVNATTGRERYEILNSYIESRKANPEALLALHTEADRIPAVGVNMPGMIMVELGRLRAEMLNALEVKLSKDIDTFFDNWKERIDRFKIV